MCEAQRYIDQAKNMASLDYSSISDNLSREILVAAIEMPEAGDQINKVFEGAKCATKAVA
jgi:hypothetical protein